MTSFAAHLLPLALLAPALASHLPAEPPAGPAPPPGEIARAAPEQGRPELGLRSNDATGALRVLEGAYRPHAQQQVRIESRVIVRISPGSEAQREQMLAALPRRPIATTFAEVDHGACVPVEDVAGVQPMGEGRLLLFLRDRRILSAALERTCSARAFYSGFYVERSEDGNLCIARDRLYSRAGSSCQLATLHRLVALRD